MTIHSVLIQKLLSTNAHLGRRLVTDPFKIYTHGIRNKQAIIDSDRTLICLRSALSFISSMARNNSQLLFVNTNPLHDEIVSCMTKIIDNSRFISKNALWKMGGVLTNCLSPKRFKSRNKKLCFGPSVPPDCVVLMDRERKSSILLEASRLGIPIVAVVDSSMPAELLKKIAYPIPANESVQFVYLFCNLITKIFLKEQTWDIADEDEDKSNWEIVDKDEDRDEDKYEYGYAWDIADEDEDKSNWEIVDKDEDRDEDKYEYAWMTVDEDEDKDKDEDEEEEEEIPQAEGFGKSKVQDAL